MPYVVLHMINRDLKAKRAVAKAVTDAVAISLKVSPEKVHVLIHEMANDQNATAGILYIDKKKKALKKKKK